MDRVRALLCASATVALCAACAGGAAHLAWPGDERRLVGHGDGATAAEAHAAALADLAAQVRARVSARTRRIAQARAEGGRAGGWVEARQEIQVDAQLAFAELARRRQLRTDGAGRVGVILELERGSWAARRRADVAADARLVLRETERLGTGVASAARWHALARAVAAARAWRAAEEEAAAVDPAGHDASGSIAQALAALIDERDRVAASLVCVVQIDGDATLQSIACAACGAAPAQALLGALDGGARRLVPPAEAPSRRAMQHADLVLRGRVERTVESADGLVFAQSRAVLTVEGDGRTLETLVVGGPATRRGHLDGRRASAAADAALRDAAAGALEARFR